MKIAIMQPYLFPYIGYWQLVNAVETFVIFDDVNFIKKGYINRNSILVGGEPQRITLEIIGASQNKLINELEVGGNQDKILKTIEMTYKKASYYRDVFPIITRILTQGERNLAKYIGRSLDIVSSYFGIETNFVYSSDLEKNTKLKGQDKIIDICKSVNAKEYINAIGGQELYDRELFKKENIDLRYIKASNVRYRQFDNDFVSNLSIIDAMMFCSVDEIQAMLNKYQLI